MSALARSHITDSFTHAANDDCINGGSCTRTKYLYDGLNAVTMSGNLLLASGNLDEIYAQVGSSSTTSFLRDGINSTAALTSSTASISANYYYSPYGDSAKTGTSTTSFQFTGRENDGATGLYYYRARYYSPQLARFISEDPIGLGGGTNYYAYALGDPIDNNDPSGEFVPLITAGIGALAGFGGSVIGQLVSNGGNFQCVKWGNAFIAGGVGAVAGAAAPFVATSWLGAVALGSSANTLQYEITQFVNGQYTTSADAAWSAGTGALSAVVGGLFRYPTPSFSQNSPWLNSATARAANIESQLNLNVGLTNALRNLGGSTLSNVSRPGSGSGSGSGSGCGCN